jgi:phthiocerol/phenolphthiocerol synthesis type-I polyketide synthase E
VSELANRLAGLSPERRRVLEQLLRQRATSPSAPAAAEPSGGDGHDPIGRFYDSVNRQLDAAEYGPFARFLNYGYIGDGSDDRAVVELPEYALNRPSVKLVLELVGDCDLDGRCVLDVGCGRGGLVDTLATYFTPRRVIGLDLCTRAVCFAAKASPQPQVRFLNGDAQRLPFAPASFDVVTNLESSHTYPAIADFYGDVHRVLKPGGAFLYSDALLVREVKPALAMLRKLGLRVEVERDITASVLRACDAHASMRIGAFRGAPEGGTLEDFLAAPGSRVYEKLKDRTCVYMIYRLRKRARA